MEKKKKYEVKVEKVGGSCDSTLFKKMAEHGDLQAVKLQSVIGTKVKIMGYAKCEITTEKETFKLNYVDTEEYGLVSTGSMIFIDSVIDYLNDVNIFNLLEVKTNKGKTYKAVPSLAENEE